MSMPQPVPIHPPLAGEWRLLRPPGHHPLAIDLVQMDDNHQFFHGASRRRFFLNGIASSRFQCWNKPVVSPVDGTVIRVGNGWMDHATSSVWKAAQLWFSARFLFRPKMKGGRLDIRPNAGNHVMIRTKQGPIVFLAHLRNQSIAVAEGQAVRQGEMIGMVGNSGNSTMPHLHLNLFDQMKDPFTAKLLPFVFTAYESLERDGGWTENAFSLPNGNAFLRFYK